MKTWLWAVWAFLIVLAGSNCSRSPGDVSSLPPIVVNTARVCAAFGPEGGTVDHPSGGKLTVPVGALDRTTQVCLSGHAPPTSEAAPTPALGQSLVASPAGLTFRKVVELTIPFDASRVPPGSSTRDAQLWMAPDDESSFVPLQTDVDLASGTMRAKTMHFTTFVPAINPNPVFVTAPDATLPPGRVGDGYSQAFAATGGTTPYAWTFASFSAAPPGLSLDSGGTLAGVPTIPSNYAFFVMVADSASHTVQAAFDLTVVAPDNAMPTLASVSPNALPQGSPTTTITLSGTGFAPTAQALWDGAQLPTTFVSDTSLAAAIPQASLATAGAHTIAVFNPAPGGGTSGTATFTVTAGPNNPVPTLATVSPSLLPVTNVDTQIAVTGSDFLPSSSVTIAGQGISTSFISATQLAATVPASFLSAPTTLTISVYNPPPGGGFSGDVAVQVGTPNPVPVLTAISPASVVAGTSAFTLSASGTGFVTGAQLFVGSTALSTTVGSATSATATVPAALVVTPGSASVTIVNPKPGGGASSALTLTLTPPSDGGAGDAQVDGGDAQVDGGAGDAQVDGGGFTTVDCAKVFQATQRQYGGAVGMDAQGRIVITGAVENALTIGTTTITASPFGFADTIFVAGLDQSCQPRWVRSAYAWGGFGGTPLLAVQADGTVTVAMGFAEGGGIDWQTHSLGPTSGSGGFSVARFDADGNFLSASNYGDVSMDHSQYASVAALRQNAGGSTLLVGSGIGSVGATTGISGNFAVAFNATGTQVFGRALPSGVTVVDGAIDATGNVTVTGWLQQPSDLGGGVLDPGDAGKATFVASYAANGSYRWAKVYLGSMPRGVTFDASGNAIIALAAPGPIDFGGGITAASPVAPSGPAEVLVSVDATGTVRWAKGFRGEGIVLGTDGIVYAPPATDAAGNILWTGKYIGTTSFGAASLPDSGTGYGTFLARFDASGALLTSSGFLGEVSMYGTRVSAVAGAASRTALLITYRNDITVDSTVLGNVDPPNEDIGLVVFKE